VAHGLITRDEGDVMIHENESLKVGDRVLLSLSVVEQEDWERGPMRIGDFGVIIEHDPTDTMLPFKVMKTGYNLSYWFVDFCVVRSSGTPHACLNTMPRHCEMQVCPRFTRAELRVSSQRSVLWCLLQSMVMTYTLSADTIGSVFARSSMATQKDLWLWPEKEFAPQLP